MKSFASDNYAGALPEIMEALLKENTGHARSYGNDETTSETIGMLREQFGDPELMAHFVFNGTGANVLSLSLMAQSWQSVLCADTSHIYSDEGSAPETFTGCRIFPIETNENGKVTPEGIMKRVIRKGDQHYSQPKAVSITQTTEYGTVYTIEEIKSISRLCKDNGLYLHMDGARFFNAAATLRCTLKEMTKEAGVDILSLGGQRRALCMAKVS